MKTKAQSPVRVPESSSPKRAEKKKTLPLEDREDQQVKTITLAVPEGKHADENSHRSQSQASNANRRSVMSHRTRSSIAHDDNCEFCGNPQRPCKMIIKALRGELEEYLNELFERRQKEFIKFIENDFDIEDQVDPNSGDVISAFYKNHNTLNKMNDNFRLCKLKHVS